MSLVLDGVSKVVEGQNHITPTDLTLERGTMNVLLGPTSSGKTTLMRLMAGLDVPATGRVIWEGRDVTGMRVVLTSRPTQIAGTLFDGLGRPAPEYAVVVFSTDRAHWANAPRRMTGLVKLDSRGQYGITGLPAGTYYLAAVTDAEPAELSDPLFLEQLATAAEVSDSQ